MKRHLLSIFFAVFCWSLLILRFGYRYGTGDQVELLPYTLFLQNQSLYVNDFFIQGLHATVPNERTVMAHLLLPFTSHLEVFCFLFQFLCTVSLVLGLEQLALRFVKNRYAAWLCILIALIPLNDFTLGNVELYSECLQASGLAVAIVVWALNFFLDRNYLLTAAFMSMATFIQLLDGLDTMLVLSVVLLIFTLRKQVSIGVFLKFNVIFGVTAGLYLLVILVKKSSHSAISDTELFNILFQFRHPHHFLFASFSIVKVAVFILLSVIGVCYFSKKSTPVFLFISLGLAGVLMYAVSVDVFHSVTIVNFQFYKVTTWIKYFGVVAVVAKTEELVFDKQPKIILGSLEAPFLLGGTTLSWLTVLFFRSYLPYSVPNQLFSFKQKDDAIEICERIKQTTLPSAVFIQPFNSTELKFFAQRSSYVEFKANVRNKLFVKQWEERIQQVFGVNSNMPLKGFALSQQADSFYYSLSVEQLNDLKSTGVTHLLTLSGEIPSAGTLILRNRTYAVYQL